MPSPYIEAFPPASALSSFGTYVSFASSVPLFSASSIYIAKRRTNHMRGNRINVGGASEGVAILAGHLQE